ncbi:MAG: histidinol phosphate phosphatase domain-containing protein [Candidatus Omnitrophota bacterium]
MYTFNLHCHSLLSDGVLLPSEVAARYAALGYTIIAITDHADYSNIKSNTKAIVEFCRYWPKNSPIKVLPGVELTHVPVAQFKPLSAYARKNGIKIIVAHGETGVEPVVPGTNKAALEADIDILAHPGLISEADVILARKKGILLEITSRHGHGKTNNHVAKLALKLGAKLVFNTDSHGPADIITPVALRGVALKVGLSSKDIDAVCKNVSKFLATKSR